VCDLSQLAPGLLALAVAGALRRVLRGPPGALVGEAGGRINLPIKTS